MTMTHGLRGLEDAVPIISMSELHNDAHAIYKRYRDVLPFIRSELGVYLVLRANDIVGLNEDQRTRQVETEFVKLRGVTTGPLFEFMQLGMLTSNGDAHRRRRAPMARTFAFKMMASLRPVVRRTAEDILETLAPRGVMEMLRDFSSILPARTISSILGLPEEDIPHFTESVYRLAPVLSGTWTAIDVPRLEKAASRLKAYVVKAIERQRMSEADTFLGQYLQAVGDDAETTEEEAVIQLMTLILAGSETTRTALVIQLGLLLGHQDQWELLRDDRSAVQNAVSECLRYEPSVGSVPRFTIEDIEIDGFLIPANSLCSLVTMSALRDENWYQDPDRFDITRAQRKWHPVFGGGAHRCLGEALARVELEESLLAMLERCPSIRPAGELPRMSGFTGIRTVSVFPVTW